MYCVAHTLTGRYKTLWEWSKLDKFEAIVVLIMAPASVLGVITFLAKHFIDSWFKSKQKEYELKLKNRLDTELHNHKENLENENLRYRVKVAGVYERQAEVLVELYTKIVDVDTELYNAINYATGNSPIYARFEAVYRELRLYYERNQILIPESIDSLIGALLNDAFWSFDGHRSAESRLANTGYFVDGQLDEIFDKKKEASELAKTVPQIKKELTNSLREIIGVPVL